MNINAVTSLPIISKPVNQVQNTPKFPTAQLAAQKIDADGDSDGSNSALADITPPVDIKA